MRQWNCRLTRGLTLFVYTAEPGTRSEDGLKQLAGWAATQALEDAAPATAETGVPPARSGE